MARPKSDTVDYFPHFAEQGKTLAILKSKFGNNGYAFWFQLLEILCREEGHYYDCRDEMDWQYLLSELGVDEVSGTEMLVLVAKMGKIDPEMWANKIIWCENLVLNLDGVYKKRHRELPDKPYFLLHNDVSVTETGITDTETGITESEMPQSKVKYSKEKEKEKESKEFPVGDDETEKRWGKIREHLKKVVSGPNYRTYFETLSMSRTNGTAFILCPNEFTREYLNTNQVSLFEKAIKDITGENLEVVFEVAKSPSGIPPPA